jgi:zinc protease
VATDGTTFEPARTERGGIPLLWADAPAPCVGALLVRSGKADETLPISGINHLVEHLALFPIGRPAYGYNGRVEDAITVFYAEGSPAEVAGFLSTVAATLADLPVDRLPVERRILLTEADGRDLGLDARLLALRFGPVGYGLANHEELGLGWLGGDDVRRWAAERFTAGNAVAWMTAEPPDDLELALPPGVGRPPPAPQPIPSLALPSELRQGTGGVALSMVAPRSTALHAGFAIAAERGHDRLRREAGLSYSVNVGYELLDDRLAHVVLQADCRDVDAVGVRDGLLSVVDDLAEQGPAEAELEGDREQFARARRDPGAVAAMLDARARDLLLGAPETSHAELERERAELRPDGVAAAFREALASLLLLVPDGTTPLADGRCTTYDPATKEALEGTTYLPTTLWREWQHDVRVVVGGEGVTLTELAGKEPLTVRFADCVAAVPSLSGKLTLIDRTGAWVEVPPLIYERGDEAVERIRAALAPGALVPLTERERALAPAVAEQLPPDALMRVPREADALLGLLGDDEDPLVLAAAERGPMAGLLVVTARRLLFVFVGQQSDLLELQRSDLRGARAKGMLRKRLVVEAGDDTHEFTALRPDGSLERLVAELQ